MKIHKNFMVFRWRKYRPKPTKVMDVLLRRFCVKCWRIRGIGRGFKMIRSKCLGCPVLEAICVVDPELKSKKKFLDDLKKKYGIGRI